MAEQWTLKVQLGKDTHAVPSSPSITLQELQVTLQNLTGVFPRQQKLIFKGKVLEGPSKTLGDLKLKDGAKVMMMTSGGGVQTGGQRAAQDLVEKRAQEAKARLAKGLGNGKDSGGNGSGGGMSSSSPSSSLAARATGWAKTGVVSLRGEGIDEVPLEAWEALRSAKVVDLGDNRLRELQAERLQQGTAGLQRLRLAGNQLDSAKGLDAAAWAAVGGMTQLMQLDLGRNLLSILPSDIGSCKALRVLSLANNRLDSLPAELGSLPQLRELDVSHNQLEVLPPELGNPSSVIETLSLSHNRLKELPSEFSALSCLASLNVASNRLTGLPSEVLRCCGSLRQLDVHDNPVTVQQLRQADGWAEFDARRKAACDKLIESRAMPGSKSFDEGADDEQWQRRW